jgi:hypothetical protein
MDPRVENRLFIPPKLSQKYTPAKIFHEEDWWTYCPNFLPNSFRLYSDVYEEIKDKVEIYQVVAPFQEKSKTFPSKRKSCKFQDTENDDNKQPTATSSIAFVYDLIPIFDWKDSPTVMKIKDLIEVWSGQKFDYCLCHLYRNGTDTLGWHSDREGLKSPIASISLGTTRKFRFREKNQTQGFYKEYDLRSGALVYMKTGCQERYKHTVPPQKRITEARINLTFRVWD